MDAPFVATRTSQSPRKPEVGLALEAIQLAPHCIPISECRIALGPFTVTCIACSSPAVVHAQPRSDDTSILVPGACATCCFINDCKLPMGHCAVIRGSAELEILSPAAVELIAVTAPERAWHSLDGFCVSATPVELFDTGVQLLDRFRTCIESLRGAADAAPVSDISCAQATALQCIGALACACSQAARARTTRDHHAVLAERARRSIHRNLTGAPRVSSVCAETGVRSRTLEYAFREVLGIPPVAYIKAMRLDHVRRFLQSASAKHRTITEIALDCGFEHLSQFAADYQRYFGETPSAARRRLNAR